MRDKDSDPSASVLDLGEDDLPEFSPTFEAGTSGASDRSDSEADDGHAEQLLYWEVRCCDPCSSGGGWRVSWWMAMHLSVHVHRCDRAAPRLSDSKAPA